MRRNNTIIVEDLMEAAKKSYLLANRFAPIRFYKSKDKYFLQ